jgi:starvation-inducible outer membrane lipoprotein
MTYEKDKIIIVLFSITICTILVSCGSIPTKMGENVRQVIDLTDEEGAESEKKVIYTNGETSSSGSKVINKQQPSGNQDD